MTSPSFAISATELTVAYGATVAVEGVTFAVPPGTTTSVIGPNGSGKSTVLRAVAGLLHPRHGALEVPAQRDRNGVAFVMQATDVDRSLSLSVGDTVRMARFPRLGLLRRPDGADRSRVSAALDRMDLSELADRPLHELSGGQRQRALVAQGLAQDSELLLLDEPFTGLDVVSRHGILDAISEERSVGRTVVYSTHDLGDAQRADQVLLMARRQIAFGPPSQVLAGGPLSEAFGGRMLRLDDGTLFVDDPHHDHDHEDAPRVHG